MKSDIGNIWVKKLGICKEVRRRNNLTDNPRFTMDSTALTATNSQITPVIAKVISKLDMINCLAIYRVVWFIVSGYAVYYLFR